MSLKAREVVTERVYVRKKSEACARVVAEVLWIGKGAYVREMMVREFVMKGVARSRMLRLRSSSSRVG